MLKLRPKEVNDSAKATQLGGGKAGTQPELWAPHAPRTGKRPQPLKPVSPETRAPRGGQAGTWQPLTWARWGVAKASRPSCWAARPACPRVASASCPPPSAGSKLFGKLAPNPPPSVSKTSLGYLLVLLQINLQVFKVTRVLGACKNVSFRHILLKLKIRKGFG